ncbi:hypothetical protein QJS04_geneDACA011234 [Acorus gramineus]|uniref:Uncharacterized protein n=1 Tax=Acorus gramineus TaxID=55184 RepID=A0AAV9AK53_ACOGR|nr:hypothetical protein QJS04_geneDACA024532 [Acorus gramineus]KAK1264511.1 hypothetical protein QJS04_geneDACA011234 [Acorus gramineus]
MKKYGGRQPTGTPSLAWSSVVVVVSLLTGASIVHNIFKPDLVRSNAFSTTHFKIESKQIPSSLVHLQLIRFSLGFENALSLFDEMSN